MAETESQENGTEVNQAAAKEGSNGMDSSLKKETSSSATPVEKKPSLPKRIWDKIGLNPGMVIIMIKGALPPVIATALYQVNSFAGIYSTLGYLVSIMSIISFAILPRAKFIQTMILNIVGVCIGAGVALLTIYCSVQARKHTTPVSTGSSAGPSPGTTVVEYNSSASAVSAIWLFANIFIANSFRAKRPSLQFPVIIYSIFGNVAATYAPQFPTMTVGIAFVKRLLEAFLTGFAIATGVSLFVFPISSRDVIFKEAAEYIASLQATLKSQTKFLETLESADMFRTATGSNERDENGQNAAVLGAQDLKAKLTALIAIHAKMAGDLTFAKREIAYSKLNGKDIDEVFKLYRMIMLPIIGMGSVADIFTRLAEKRGWSENKKDEIKSSFELADLPQREKEVADWNAIIRAAHSSFTAMNECLDEGLNHVLYTLEFAKKPKKSIGAATQQTVDVEAKGEAVEPGDEGFAASFKSRIDRYYQQREDVLKLWKQQKGLDFPTELEGQMPHPSESNLTRADQQQLYLMLYLEFLHYSTGLAVLDLINFADGKVESGAMKKRRLILPGKRRIMKWIKNACSEDQSSDHTPDHSESGAINVFIGDSLQGKGKDPEHLPPTNAWERFGDGIRFVSDFFASDAASFGFRVACATMSIGILAYLKATQTFFVEQRIVWAMIMVAIGMTVTAGSGVFGLMGRVAGTFIAMIMSFAIWYIAGGRGVPAGVIVLLFFVIFCEIYFLIKLPRFTPVVLITMVTQVLILGYELEVKVLGVAVATSSGQLYYPIYELAPYRLATVAAGCFVGFLWLYFPYPVTARGQLRKDLGASLFLLANFYSAVHTTVRTRLKGDAGDMSDKHSPARKLDKARNNLFSNEMALLAGLRVHSSFTAFEFTLGGKFPKAQYDAIITQVQSILFYMALIAYSSRSFSQQPDTTDAATTGTSSTPEPPPPSNPWLTNLARLISTTNLTSLQTTSLLSLLASSISTGTALPPFLTAPPPYQIREKMEELDHNILSVDHVAEPGYAAFAVGQVASVLIHDDLEKLLKGVRELVGEVDFRYYPIGTEERRDEERDIKEGVGKSKME